jgi:hypothetical protein
MLTKGAGKRSNYNDSVRAGRSGDRIPVGASPYRMGTVSFPGTKRPGRGVNHPPRSSAEVKERVELHLYSPSGSPWQVKTRNLQRLYLSIRRSTWGEDVQLPSFVTSALDRAE